MTVLKDSSIYRQNALMNANLFYLGAALFVFGIFNAIFVGGFFRTAHKLGKISLGSPLSYISLPHF